MAPVFMHACTRNVQFELTFKSEDGLNGNDIQLMTPGQGWQVYGRVVFTGKNCRQ